MLQKRKKINNNKLVFLVVVIGVTIGSIISSSIVFTKKPTKDTTKVLNAIEQVVELSTIKYNYSDIIAIKKDKSFKNIKIPFTEKSFIIKYNGTIKGGVKSQDINIRSNKSESIIIDIKKCSIIDHYIDESKVYVYDIKNSLFNKVDINEVIEEISKGKKEYEDKTIKEGFMKEIKASTTKSLKSSLGELGYKKIEINFQQ